MQFYNDTVKRLNNTSGKDFFYGGGSLSWAERFSRSGFIIDDVKLAQETIIRQDDNEQGALAHKLGIKISVISKAYYLHK